MDPLHLEIANHEAGHAAGAIVRGHRVVEMFHGRSAGRTIHLPPAGKPLEEAAISRIGGLYAGDDWNGVRCEADRERVEALCPAELFIRSGGVELWVLMVTQEATAIMREPRFRVLAQGLAGALRERWNMDKDEIAEAALLLEDAP